MPAIRWSSDVSGYFANAADWKGGVVPGASDGAILKASGSPFTVTSTADETVKSVQLGANATLDISGGTFDALTGTGQGANQGANAGVILVGAGATFEIGGALKNTGEIALQGAKSSDANLWVGSDTTLSGGGTVMLGGYGQINAAPGAGVVTLTNVDDTISGSGQIGSTNARGLNQLGLELKNDSEGVISNVTLGPQRRSERITIYNDGLLENITTSYSVIDGAGGTILAAGGRNGVIQHSSITGEMLTTGSGSSLLLPGDSITVGGVIENAGAMTLSGGTITLNANITLTGGGGFAFQSTLSVTNSGNVLTNVDNDFFVDGNLVNDELTLVNERAGTIVTQAAINTGLNTISNAGVIKGSGNCLMDSPINNTGMIIESDFNTMTVAAAVSGTGSVTIDTDGTINFESSFNQNVTFLNVDAGPRTMLELAQSQSYTAKVTGFSTNGWSALDLRDIGFVSASEASFNGISTSGVLTVSDGTHTAHITLDGDYLATTFTCSSDGKGGVIVTGSSGEARAGGHPAPATPHALASAIAALAPAHASNTSPAHQPWRETPPMLAAARGQLA